MYKALGVAVVLAFCAPQPAHALLPPDLIFSIGAQFVQFFSVIALLVGGFFTSTVLIFRQGLSLTKHHAWAIIAIVLGVVLTALSVVYITETDKRELAFQARLTALEDEKKGLEEELANGITAEELEVLKLALTASSTGSSTPRIPALSGYRSPDKIFAGDMFTLYSDAFEDPFVLELDLNRREDSRGVFVQYYFLNGTWNGSSFADYGLEYATTSVPQPNDFVKQYERVQPADLSTRDSYRIEVEVKGDIMTIVIEDAHGDFITRDHPAFTRYQSVATAEVTYRGETFAADALVEGTHSHDYSQYIFFDGYENIDVTTHQFLLWDERGNFYMIDNSDVRSDTPEYPSHSWLLFKDGVDGSKRKGFETDVIPGINADGQATWSVTAPEFDRGELELAATSYFKNDNDTRIRAVVAGTVFDKNGVREVSGVLHLVK